MRSVIIIVLGLMIVGAGKDQANFLRLWTRKAGSYGDGNDPGRDKSLVLTSNSLKLKEKVLFDVQYGKKLRYRGVPISQVFAQFPRKESDDLALLKFENGMQIAVPPAFDGFLALEICSARNVCKKEFPSITKDDDDSRGEDPRPIQFRWNKVVYSEKESSFSPWRHADSLIGIEFVNSVAYDKQFEVGEPEGYDIFKARCAHCHGVRQVGAAFGWDVVGSIPLFEKRPPKQLLIHIKYPKTRAKAMGLMMPVQDDITAEETQQIWNLFRKLANRPLRPYTP